MDNIYGSATIAIAAVASKDGDGGCFAQDKVVTYSTSKLHHASSMAIRKRVNHYGYSSGHVLQRNERPLFSQVTFQCRTTLECHCGRIKEEIDGQHGRTIKLQEFEEVRGDSIQLYQAHRSWARIVTQYTGRHLTMEGDRLPALSGLAKAFEARGLGTFIAGLWTKDLPLWLTWVFYKRTYEPNAGQQHLYVAPSWSWASRPAGGTVDYPILEYDVKHNSFVVIFKFWRQHANS
ncbi:hypothetical protein BKA61DRAFT_696987 [Leptodontidium sp. MPI-SDFR-AT-0119]|nr:hypothetical protein BKA61DRAFT_696987 [Leptodontidium sp. MPI-SDFR-AT-0119]